MLLYQIIFSPRKESGLSIPTVFKEKKNLQLFFLSDQEAKSDTKPLGFFRGS